MKFNRDIIDRIVLDTAKNPITFVKDAQNTWSVVSPVDKNVPMETISNIFSISRFLIAHDLYAETPTDKQIKDSGLDKPRIKISLFQKDNLISEVDFGKSWTTEEQNVYFRTKSGAGLFMFPERTLIQI